MRMATAMVALVAAAGLAGAAAAQGVNLNGRYQASGTNFDGSRYGGNVEINYTSETSCRIVWRVGGAPIRGICMRYGTTFAASYVMNGKAGMVIYQLQPDGALHGVWTLADQDGVGRETLVPAR